MIPCPRHREWRNARLSADRQDRYRVARQELNERVAQLGRALGNGHRIEILDLLAQGERSVEVLADRAGIGIGLASAHLQVLRRAGLVHYRRDGARVVYRLAGADVVGLLGSLREVATARIAEAERAARTIRGEAAETLTREQLLERVREGRALVIDLRPPEEYRAGHLPGAISLPLEELEARLAELPSDLEIVAYCRGPLCALAPQGVEILRRAGRRALRLQDGFPEWQLAGLPVSLGDTPA